MQTVQAVLGHADVATTMKYAHVLRLDGGTVRCSTGYDGLEQSTR